MKILKVKYKNIQSCGNTPIQIDITDKHTIIGGSNGAGKSLLGNVITYGLFGKFPSGIKLEDAINSINKKNLEVNVTFIQNGFEYIVRRGEKPKIFEIYKDGEMLNQNAHARDQQKELEKIIGMDYNLFTQIVFLNKERYIPFMDMSAGDRRKVVDDILGVKIFTIMNDIVGEDIKILKNQMNTIESDIRMNKTKSDGIVRLIDDAKKNAEQNMNDLLDKLVEYKSSLVIHKREYRDYLDKIKLLEDKKQELEQSLVGYDDVVKQKKEFEKIGYQLENKIKSAKKNNEFYETNDNCPTCKQIISKELKSSIKSDCDNVINESNQTANELMKELSELINRESHYLNIKKEIDAVGISILNYKSQIRSSEVLINNIQKEIQSIENKEKANIKQDDNKIKDYEIEYNGIIETIELLQNRYNDADKQSKSLNQVKGLLRDDAIKSVIVKEYIDLMNKKINEYLSAMEFYINIRLDENFKESFHSINKEKFTIANLSTGQKTRVNIAILLALLEISAIKNSANVNILFLDEILENLDEEGTALVIKLLKDKLYNKSIFVITQRYRELESFFDNSLRFRLNGGFTEIED